MATSGVALAAPSLDAVGGPSAAAAFAIGQAAAQGWGRRVNANRVGAT